MPTPIVETIRLNVISTLEGITVAGGYNNTVTVQAFKRAGNTPADRLIVVEQMDPSETPESERSQQHHEWSQPFRLTAYLIESETSATAIDASINGLVTDIHKRMLVDTGRGGIANDTFVGPPEYGEDASGGYAAVQLEVRCVYRTLYGNPNSQ